MQNTHSSLYIRNTNPRGEKARKAPSLFLWLRTCRYCVCISAWRVFKERKRKWLLRFDRERVHQCFCRFSSENQDCISFSLWREFFFSFSVTLPKKNKKSSNTKSTRGTSSRDWAMSRWPNTEADARTPRSTYRILLCGRSCGRRCNKTRLGVSVSWWVCIDIVPARHVKMPIQTKSLREFGCSKSFKKKKKKNIRGGGKKRKHFLLFILKLFVYFRFIFFICSSLFTMFESTKFNLFMTVHIYSFVFLFLYYVFCFPFVAVLYIVCMDFFSFFVFF